MKDVFLTWREIQKFIAEQLPKDQLDEPAQILLGGSDENIIPLNPIYGMNTIEHYCQLIDDKTGEAVIVPEDEVTTRSVDDGQHHPSRYVLLADSPTYSKDGDSYYTLLISPCGIPERKLSNDDS